VITRIHEASCVTTALARIKPLQNLMLDRSLTASTGRIGSVHNPSSRRSNSLRPRRSNYLKLLPPRRSNGLCRGTRPRDTAAIHPLRTWRSIALTSSKDAPRQIVWSYVLPSCCLATEVSTACGCLWRTCSHGVGSACNERNQENSS
jgi:hypothetical protein